MPPKQIAGAKAQGWLAKPAGMFKSMKDHFVVLFEDRVEYFKDDENVSKPIRALPLANCTVSAAAGKPQCFQLQGNGLKKVYLFQAESENDAKAWMKKIEGCITKLHGKGKNAAEEEEAPAAATTTTSASSSSSASTTAAAAPAAAAAKPKKEVPLCLWCKEKVEEVPGKFSGVYHDAVDGGKLHDECRTAYELDKRGKSEGREGLKGQIDYAAAQVEGDDLLEMAGVTKQK